MVRDPATHAQYVTQAGNFQVNTLGTSSPDGPAGPGHEQSAALSTIGDLQITTDPSKTGIIVVSYNIDSSGNINVVQSDGTTYVSGQIGLNSYSDPQMLVDGRQ